MTTLVTGASGFIGSKLLQPGHTALVRCPAGLPHEKVGDLLDTKSLKAACAGVTTVFHCAGYAHAFASTDLPAHWRINYEGTRNLVEAAGQAGVRSFVFLSSVKAMPEPGNTCITESWPGQPATPYGIAKRAAEDAVLQAGIRYGMHVVSLRLAMVYGRGGRGNLERLAKAIRAGWFPQLPKTGNRRSLVHVNDVISAIHLVAHLPQANGQTYIVAHPHAYSGSELCQAILAASPTPRFSWQAPAWLLRGAGKAGDIAGCITAALLNRPFPINSDLVSRLLDSECYSPARIQHELGWQAQISLSEGLQEMLASKPLPTPKHP
ncbi:MAG: NAD-dependent epimerase/dehydratase family protein [Limnobacter sp.]|nr:NAD-dependent epimerase/dehydratase family protein [Limnobacter sp.]